ncbi:hypothetical protein FHW84_002376 [Dyella sp. SG562]|uniref:glycoside hydrolase domain-containing protein n=1 Tax=Dyella sp. SG562 TaxID=2587017 RepID=UPI001422E221|nr:glycoside hydrolase domain-containing protein [Dyella sp. SG562]NII73803.1 hypothetical protein [Dyella sp. SG562]
MRQFYARAVLACMMAGASLALAPVANADEHGAPVLRWDPAKLGNHRYLVQVDAPAEAVHVVIPWRRRDAHPEKLAVIVADPDGAPVANLVTGKIDRASGELVFQAAKAGTYAVYYQPYVGGGRSNYPVVTYAAARDIADPAWAGKLGKASAWNRLPQAQVLRYEAVDDFDAYTEMERTATPAELDALLAKHAGPLLLFPETRANPVRMFDTLPASWAQRGPGGDLSDSALRGEYLSFQIGLWAARAPANAVRVAFGDLHGPDGAVIPATALTCFNLRGIDYTGQPFGTRVDVAKGRVQPLWMGVDIPADAKPGVYQGEVSIGADGVDAQRVPLSITVGDGVAVAHGDDDPFKLTRLRWLDSTLAQDDAVVKPFTPIAVKGATLDILGRDIALADSGLPAQIQSRFDERMTGFARQPQALLQAPMQLLVEDGSGVHALAGKGMPKVETDGPGKVHWTVTGNAGPLRGEVKASLEADGTLQYAIELQADRETQVGDIRLEMPLRNEVAHYQLGLGQQGGEAPTGFSWHWNVRNNQDGAWIGAVNAGLEFHLRDEHYLRPLNTNFYQQQPLRIPQSWDNGGQGGIDLERGKERYLVRAFSGSRTLKAGQTLRYDVVLRVTPFKTIQPAQQFGERFFHKYGDLDAIKADGANVVNIHHATPINPWINYPFLEAEAMRRYIDAAHQRGMRVKIYDTIRELSDRAPELPMLESLGHEVISAGKGGGFSWLQEHLDGDYIPAWHVPENRDAAVINAGQSRWHNYYIEGLDWLARNEGIDGLYLDDVAYDRTTMKRVRKVLQARRQDPLIDLHSANQYNPRDGYINSSLLYMELFPYIDRLWFGEYFDYEKSTPAYWLTEISGIPYGLMGEMLQNDGNPWRGMVFGMTSRLGWSPKSDPRPLWKLWDGFGIAKAEMIGWWVHDAPVKTGRDDVLATSYVRKGQGTLVALASWAPERTEAKLAIDWKALGLNPAKAKLVAPAIPGFQPAATFKPGDAIPVEPGKGWLLRLE